MGPAPAARPRVLRLRHTARQLISLPPLPGRERERRTSPAVVVWGLLGVITVGTLLLLLPAASEDGHSAGLITALFTATSAACTTGIVVRDTQEQWSLAGEAIILLLMQVGGLGFLVSSTLVLMLIGRVTLQDRLELREALGEGTLGGILQLVRRIILFALVVETIGAVLLSGFFATHERPLVAVWYGVFHSVAAFTNAGFDLLGGVQSFSPHRDDPYVLIVISTLIMMGGISYAVVADVWRRRRFARLALDSKLVLVTSLWLLFAGTIGFLALEFTNDATLRVLSGPQVVLQAFFFSVAARSAGFSALNVGALREETLFFMMGLMFIGGAAGSTAGGIKVNSVAVLAAVVISASKGRERVVAFGREIGAVIVMRALTVATLALIVVLNATLLLTIIEDQPFLPLAFEAVSAFSTAGLSTGITPELSVAGKLVLVATMFVGRLGPLALAVALVRREQGTRVRYPQDTVRIG